MKALVYKKPNDYGLMDVPIPKILKPTDVIGKVTLSAICTSDIHTVRGEIDIIPYPMVVGHEFCIEVIEAGAEVKNFKPGDRCVVSPGIYCGECIMCEIGVHIGCLDDDGKMFGGSIDGCQAEYVRIPWADRFMYKIPDGLTEEDVILVPDMLATGWFGLKNAQVQKGQCIAVIGCGPVGLSTCLLAKKVLGAKVIAVDILQERLDLALKEGIADVAFNPNDEDAVQIFMEATGGFGCDATIETGGIAETFTLAVTYTKPDGIVSSVAIYAKPIEIPMPEITLKNLEIKTGVQKCKDIDILINLIQKGIIDAKFMLTHKAPLNDIMKGYEVFGKQADGCVKWLVTPYVK